MDEMEFMEEYEKLCRRHGYFVGHSDQAGYYIGKFPIERGWMAIKEDIIDSYFKKRCFSTSNDPHQLPSTNNSPKKEKGES